MNTKNKFKSLLVIIGLLLTFSVQSQIPAPPITINVATAGTLNTLLGTKANQITDLTLTGKLNGSDIGAIRGMTNLTILNIENVDIVSGGGAYYGVDSRYYYTSDNVIGYSMFCNLKKLQSIILPNSSVSMDSNAFNDCTGLTSVTIGNSKIYIAGYSFEGCTAFKEFIVSEENTKYSTIDGVLYNKDKTTLVAYPYAKATTYIIPESVTSIQGYAFYQCTGLTSVTIGNSVTSIGSWTFSGCTSLTSVTIGNNVTSIGQDAFYKCIGLTSVTIPNSVTSIGYNAFYGCRGLTSLIIGNSVKSIGGSAFYQCTGLTSIIIPDSVTMIGNGAFSSCIGLTSLIIGNSVTSIEGSAFWNCKGLASIIIPDNVTSIGSSAFGSCTELTSITIGNSVKSIGESAFENCTGLTSVTIPNCVTSIGNRAFYNCTGLTEIHSQNSTPPTVGTNCFYNVNRTTCNLYVPKGSYAAYWLAPVWGDFGNIIEEDVTAINTISKDKIVIHSNADGIAIATKEAIPVSIFNIAGQKVYQSVVTGSAEISLNKGIYVVSVNNESQKIIVK
ncbi:MAG: leucine-rich repeat domain-containing protein [Candidatus Symbiothrix sp.]|jgi:hypothetical protein|nr:leucine-rich repeat domain-containing protein [Candidatus Symbiothrix sp.]